MRILHQEILVQLVVTLHECMALIISYASLFCLLSQSLMFLTTKIKLSYMMLASFSIGGKMETDRVINSKNPGDSEDLYTEK